MYFLAIQCLFSGQKYLDTMVKESFKLIYYLVVVTISIVCHISVSHGYGKTSKSTNNFLSDQKVFSLISGDINGDGRKEFILGCINDRVYVLNSSGDVLWSIGVNGLPFSMDLADINGDGKKELLVASLDEKGTVYAIEYLKGVLWTYSAEQPFLSLSAGDIDGDKRYEIALGSFRGQLYLLDNLGKLKTKKSLTNESSITSLVFGDINNNKGDELIIGTSTEGVFVLNNSLNIDWKIGVKSNRFKMFWVRSLSVEDINSDGENELIIGSRPSGLITVVNGTGKIIWQKNFPEIVNPWSTAQVKVGNITGDDKKELISLLQGVAVEEVQGNSPIIVLDSGGNILNKHLYHANFFSIDLINLEKKYDDIVLSSSVDGNGILKFALNEQGENSYTAFQDNLYSTISIMAEQINPSLKKSDEESPTTHLIYRLNYEKVNKKKSDRLDKYIRSIKSYGAGNLSVEIILTGIYQKNANLSKKYNRRSLLSEEEILKIVGQLEKSKVPYYINIGKHGLLFLRLETLGKILTEGRNYCRGFVVDENNYTQTKRWTKFIENMENTLDILSKHPGKKLIMNEYLDFWHKIPLDSYVYERLFKPMYKNILIPVYKPNNLKSPELNIGTLVGLWKGGSITEWGVGAYGDMMKWESSFISTPGHVILRFMVMAQSLGGNYFVVGKNLTSEDQELEEMEGVYDQSFKLFSRLITNLKITPVKDPKDVFISHIALQEVDNIEEKTLRKKGNKEYWQSVYTMAGFHVPGFILQSVRKDYIPAYLYNLTHYYDGLFPRTQNGFVALFPASMDPLMIDGIKDYFIVGRDKILLRDGKEIPRDQIKDAITNKLKQNSNELPFRAEGVFFSSNKIKNGYRVYLVNPEFFETRDVKTELLINLKGNQYKVIDNISGKELDIKNNKIEINVPAGLFRILEVSPIK